jgi:hypothetical protein
MSQKSLAELGFGHVGSTIPPIQSKSMVVSEVTPSGDRRLKRKEGDRDSPLGDPTNPKETRLALPNLNISLELPEDSDISISIQLTIARTIESSLKPFTNLLSKQTDLITSYLQQVDRRDKEMVVLKEEVATLKAESHSAADFQKEVTALKQENQRLNRLLEKKCEELEQYERRNAIRIRNVTIGDIPKVSLPSGKEMLDTDAYVRNLCMDKLRVNITENGIGRSHLTGPPRNNGLCSILVKFATYNI